MGKIKCDLYCYSNSPHLQQIYTGFSSLERQGAINLTFKLFREKPSDLRGAGPNGLKVVINDEKILFYDTFDGYQINPNVLDNVDYYFKRSYLASSLSEEIKALGKVFPLGLNYLVYDNSLDFFLLKRSVLDKQLQGKITNSFAALAIDKLLRINQWYVPREKYCHQDPIINLEPRVIFMTHLWDPKVNSAKSELLGLNKESKDSINEMRVACIRALKKEFGDKFLGGVALDNYSSTYSPDCVLPSKQLSKKSNYLKLLREFPICVATTGLFGSIGWKFAEYVCFSKAIVSEKLNYVVPGFGGAENNYIEFSTPDECVSATVRLFEDPDLRKKIMLNNYRYYQSCLRPDLLIMSTLTTATSS